MSLLNSTIQSINDPETIILVQELSTVTGVGSNSFSNSMLLHFLQQCLFPNGGSLKPVKLSKDDLDEHDPHDDYLLRKKVGKVGDPLYQTFEQLAIQNRHNRYGIEHYNGTAIYMFLNKMIVPVKPRPNPRFFK